MSPRCTQGCFHIENRQWFSWKGWQLLMQWFPCRVLVIDRIILEIMETAHVHGSCMAALHPPLHMLQQKEWTDVGARVCIHKHTCLECGSGIGDANGGLLLRLLLLLLAQLHAGVSAIHCTGFTQHLHAVSACCSV